MTARTAIGGTLRRRVAALWRRGAGLRRRAADRAPLLALLGLALVVQAIALARVLPGPQPPPTGDSVVFEYHGWALAHGGRLYLDLWEVKPPLSYQTTAVLALAADGNRLLYHYLAVGLTNAAAVGCVVLVGALAADVSRDCRPRDPSLAGIAAVVAGLAAYASPVVFMRATYGFKAKYFVVLAGLLAVVLLLRDRPFTGGAAAAAAVGYWQLGAVFTLVAVGLARQRGGWRAVGRVAAGGLAMAAVTLGPVAVDGGLVAMFAQTVLVPLHVAGEQPFGQRVWWLANLLSFANVVVVLGAIGVGLATYRAGRRHWWLPVVWGWFAGHLLVLNVDYYGDLIPLLVVNGIGVGALVALPGEAASAPWRSGARRSIGPAAVDAMFGVGSDPSRPWGTWPPIHPGAAVGLVVAVLVLVNVATLGAVIGTDAHPVDDRSSVADADAVDPPYFDAERRALLFGPAEASTCHVFTSTRQRAWIELTGGTHDADVCGRLPSGYGWLRDAVPEPLRGPSPS